MLCGLPLLASAVPIEWVTVGNPGNAVDTTTSFGAVSYEYRISTYKVTNAQYAEFLNAVDAGGNNPHGIYDAGMTNDARGGIRFSAQVSEGSKYEVKPGFEKKPVVFVGWFEAARFANWLHNGASRGANMETGAYDLNGETRGSFMKEAKGKFWIPTEDEWYKAAFYDPRKGSGGGYWLYATQSDTIPNSRPPNDTDANSGNFFRLVDGSTDGNKGYAVTGNTDASDAINFLTDVGVYKKVHGFYGTFDQAGNVWDWVDNVVNGKHVLRGGCWANDIGKIDVLRNSFRMLDPGFKHSTIGFRMAAAPAGSLGSN